MHKPFIFIVFDSFKLWVFLLSLTILFPLMTSCFQFSASFQYSSVFFSFLKVRQTSLTILLLKSWFVWWCFSLNLTALCPLQVVLVFPGPGAVSVQDMMQCLYDRTDSKSHYTFDMPCIKRLKREEVQGATHASDNSESGTPDEAKGPESRVSPLQRVVFIDSTWNQTNKISTDERLQGNHERLHLCRFSKSSDCWWLLGPSLSHPRCCWAWSHSVFSDWHVLSSRSTAGRAECQKNLFLAPSERQTRHLLSHHRGYLLFPQGLPWALPCWRIQWRIR